MNAYFYLSINAFKLVDLTLESTGTVVRVFALSRDSIRTLLKLEGCIVRAMTVARTVAGLYSV